MSNRSSEALSPFPRRLKEARLVKGLSQKNLGIIAGIDEFSASSRMNQYEKGKHTPDFATLKRLAEALDVPTGYFYCEEDWLGQSRNSTAFASCIQAKQIAERPGIATKRLRTSITLLSHYQS